MTNPLKNLLANWPTDVVRRLLVGRATEGDQILAANIISLTQNTFNDIIGDEIASLYHPEFGTEWRAPDGSMYKIVKSAELRTLSEATEEVRRLFDKYRDSGYDKTDMESIILGNLNRMITDKKEDKQ